MTTESLPIPDIEWLQRCWSLPEARVPLVRQLMEAANGGGTAILFGENAGNDGWGNALVQVEVGVALPEAPRPLVAVRTAQGCFLQTWLDYATEQRIAAHLRNRANLLTGVEVVGEVAILLQRLFPNVDTGDLQAQAARRAVERRLTLITGGPGSGKTHTLARILALLTGTGVDPSRIRLAAPTGKAAERMRRAVTEAVQECPAAFGEAAEPLRSIASGAATLHKLLGIGFRQGQARFHGGAPLPCDVLIIDECSMVDVLLWRAVLEAAPMEARVILVGDPHQLESVGRGNVLAELVRVAGDPQSCLHPVRVHLSGSHRFRDRPAILELAKALEAGDGAMAAGLLEVERDPEAPRGVSWMPVGDGPLRWDQFPEGIRAALARIAFAESPAEALTALGRVCILTAQRDYFVGAKAVGAAMEAHFAAQTGGRETFHPIIIQRNDAETGLRNGYLGVVGRSADGTNRAWFPDWERSDGLRSYSLAQLPEHIPAWALTVHRSQGSEYDEVLVILPRQDSPLATRELIYTAITRARRTVHLVGNLAAVVEAAGRRSGRVTMTGAHLDAGLD